jgi:hypothetical protein
MMEAKLGKPVLLPLALLLTAAVLLVGLTSSASAGNGEKGAGAPAHGKCKKKSNGNDRVGSKKRKCRKSQPGPGKKTPPAPVVTPPAPPPVVTPPAPPVVIPPAMTTLAINPASFDFGTVAHGGFEACVDPDPDCPTQAFTVTNTGGSTSGVPTASIVEIHNPETSPIAAFEITANTCTASLAPGATCSLTVKFAPHSNAGDEMFSSQLDVSASPGSTVSSVLSGMGT